MIKAYHHVERFPLEKILKKGAIFPVAFRLDPEYLQGCMDLLFTVRENVADEGNPEAIRGVELLIEKRWNEIAAVSSRETDETGLFCGDVLAGDAFSVFLSTGGWGRVEEEVAPNGFVFDAEDLIRRGALFRGDDLLGNYDYTLEGAAWLKGSATAIRDELERQLDAVQKRWQVKGEAAIAKLRKDPEEWDELVFAGPVNLKWAVEMWDDGELVAMTPA